MKEDPELVRVASEMHVTLVPGVRMMPKKGEKKTCRRCGRVIRTGELYTESRSVGPLHYPKGKDSTCRRVK